MRRKLWISAMAAVIGLLSLMPSHAMAGPKSAASICLAPGAICDHPDQCCTRSCNLQGGGPGTCGY